MARTLTGFLTASALILLAACGDGPEPPATLAELEEEGVLRVATRNGATTYYLDRHGQPSGPEYDLVEEFAAAQGWEVKWRMYDTTAAVLEVLEEGRAHLAAAGLTHRASRDQRFARGPAHTEVREQVVCHREMQSQLRTPADLAKVDIHVTAGSAYVETLQALQEEHPDIEFVEDAQRTSEILLSRVAERRIECAVADSNIVEATRRHWPYLAVAMDLTEGQNLGWYLPADHQPLAETAREWMNSRAGNEAIDAMISRYYAYIGEFDFVDLRALNRRIEERLPRYKRYFEQAEESTGIPADLLAALSYQESHWDPEARSPTGVRGLMMLTQRTAESLGVDRSDPRQAIEGGARYLAEMHRRLSDDIPEPDRMFLALASYNIGRGHLLDARQLAREQGRDPDSWDDMREILPLKADPRYYPSTRYGYARGYEPVHFVQRIRNYRDVIAPAFD